MRRAESELILNPDGSIYHLMLQPGDLAETIITVGDPERVTQVSQMFDRIHLKKGKREFITHTGELGGKPISVLSTGIGTDNIDIVLNEVDALFNFDFEKRTPLTAPKSVKIVRIGTTGAIQPEHDVDQFLCSTYTAGFDNLLQFYRSDHVRELPIEQALSDFLHWPDHFNRPYVVKGETNWCSKFIGDEILPGFTATNSGFYGPQGRQLRLQPYYEVNDKLADFRFDSLKITNLEMETSGIYGLSALLGHQAASLNAIIAHRGKGKFSSHPERTVKQLIALVLEKLSGS